MTILTRQKKERLVLELYNQGKTYREISKEARISPRDIGVILNKVIEEKREGLKEEQQEDNDSDKNQEQHSTLSTQAYKLFSEGKTPIEVAIVLNLGESEVTKFCKEYWKLKQLHNLNIVYEEIKDNIGYFVRLYKLAKGKGIGVQQVVVALEIANNDLLAIEERFKRIRNDVIILQFQKHICKRNLYQLNNQIPSTTRLLSSLRISCKRERTEIKNLCNEKARLEAIVTEYKSNNEEYLKINQVAEEKVKDVTNGKLLLKFATLSVIESLRNNPELCNIILHYISDNNTDTTCYGSNHPSFISAQHQQQQSFNDICTAVIIEEAEKLYNKLTTKLTDDVMAAAADIRPLSLPSTPRVNNKR